MRSLTRCELGEVGDNVVLLALLASCAATFQKIKSIIERRIGSAHPDLFGSTGHFIGAISPCRFYQVGGPFVGTVISTSTFCRCWCPFQQQLFTKSKQKQTNYIWLLCQSVVGEDANDCKSFYFNFNYSTYICQLKLIYSFIFILNLYLFITLKLNEYGTSKYIKNLHCVTE